MRIALIGATGFVGAPVLAEAVGRGHDVTALVRDVTTVPSGATAVACDVRDTAALTAALRGPDVVVSAFNPGHDIAANPHLYRDIVEGAVSIVRATTAAQVPHLVYLGGAGSLLRRPGLFVADDPGFPADYGVGVPSSLQHFADDKAVSTDVPLAGRTTLLLLQHDRSFAWSYLSPPLFLQPGERTGRYLTGGEEFAWDGESPAGMSLADYAVAVVDECETRAHLHAHVGVRAA